MCNCYDHPCEVCKEMIPIHLEDYDTDPQEIVVICVKCVPKYLSMTSPNKSKDIRNKEYTEYLLRRHSGHAWKRVRIYSMTANARRHKGGNTPNCDYTIV